MEERIYQPDGPDSGEGLRNYDIVRCRTYEGFDSFVILSDRILHTRTHYDHGTQPCTHPNCRYCDKGRKSEYHGYVIAGKPKDFTKILLELTSPAARKLLDEFRDHRTLHGCCVRLSRKNGKPNGAVHCEIIKRGAPTLQFGSVPEVLPILHTIWRFNPEREAIADSSRRRREAMRGEPETGHTIPIADQAEQVLGHQKGRRKRS